MLRIREMQIIYLYIWQISNDTLQSMFKAICFLTMLYVKQPYTEPQICPHNTKR